MPPMMSPQQHSQQPQQPPMPGQMGPRMQSMQNMMNQVGSPQQMVGPMSATAGGQMQGQGQNNPQQQVSQRTVVTNSFQTNKTKSHQFY